MMWNMSGLQNPVSYFVAKDIKLEHVNIDHLPQGMLKVFFKYNVSKTADQLKKKKPSLEEVQIRTELKSIQTEQSGALKKLLQQMIFFSF